MYQQQHKLTMAFDAAGRTVEFIDGLFYLEKLGPLSPGYVLNFRYKGPQGNGYFCCMILYDDV